MGPDGGGGGVGGPSSQVLTSYAEEAVAQGSNSQVLTRYKGETLAQGSVKLTGSYQL